VVVRDLANDAAAEVERDLNAAVSAAAKNRIQQHFHRR
jgi:hypothetical protein